jgi:hypothetical protein
MAMKANATHLRDPIDFGGSSEPEFISIPIPDDFHEMDLNNRITYVANELRSLESKFNFDRGELIRHTSLVRIEDGKFMYSVEYVPVMDNEY